MPEDNDDQWLWVVDDEPIDTPLTVEPAAPPSAKAITSPEVVKAVSLHLSGKSDDAIKELKGALDKGGSASEIYSTLGQIFFERQRFQEAADAYGKLISSDPYH